MVQNLIKNGTDFLFKKQTSILSAAAIIAVSVFLSRCLGLLKYRLLTDRFTVADIGVFIAAFRLPNTIFDLVVLGALTTAFIPIFTSYIAKEKYDDANRLASTVLNLCTVFFLLSSFFLLILAEPILRLIAPGLTLAEIDLAVPFTRIMLVGQTLPLILGNFLTGVLQSHKRFLIPALAPILYNVGIITGIVLLSPSLGLYGPVWGTVFGAFLFLAIQIPIFGHLKFHYRFTLDLKDKGVNSAAKLILPRTLGLIATQIGYFVNLAITSLISTRAITIFSFAQQLAQLPIGIFASTIATAALPTLSEENDRNDNLSSFKKTFLTSLHQILFLTLPAAAILIVLRIPIVRLVYGSAKFDWPATVETGRTLAFFGLALIAESVVNLLVRGFYALQDSTTPVLLGVVSVVVNVAIAIAIIFALTNLDRPVWGLAAATAVADSLLAILLTIALHRQVHRFNLTSLLLPATKMLIAAVTTGVSLYIPMKLLDQLVFDTTRTVPLIMLTGTATTIGLSVYLFFTWLLQIDELKAFLGLFTKIKRFLLAPKATISEAVAEISPETLPQTTHEH